MDNAVNQEDVFYYKYSAEESSEIKEAKRICAKYQKKKGTELETLHRLDAKVKRPANIFGYMFGSIGAIVMGSGMSLVMTDIGEKIGMTEVMMPGILVGLAGMLMILINYPIYKKILDSRRKKYADEVIALSEKIINQ